jgi:hypothetical protein
MMSGLISFLGGSAFRMIWGEVASFIKAREDHKHELEMLNVQAQLEAAAFERNQSALKLQAELGIRTIQVQSEADLEKLAAIGFNNATAKAMKPIGVAWVDAFNAAIRPSAAAICLFLWVFELAVAGWVMGEWDQMLVATILGFFFADRGLAKRGK